MNDTAKLLRKAAQVLRERGWCQGDYVDDNGCVCINGACAVAAGVNPGDAPLDASKEVAAVENLVRPFLVQAVGESPVEWNDRSARVVDEVLAALERAAVIAEQGGVA